MKTKLVERSWDSWPGTVRRRLTSLTVREDSGMKAAIKDREIDRTFVLFEDKDPVAWAIASWDGFNCEYDIMLYVRRNRRDQGYGKRLFRRAKNWVTRQGDHYYVFHDGANNGFWRKMGELNAS